MSATTPSTKPASAAAADQEYQLPINGFEGTPDEIERQWFEKCYKGRGDSMLQLTTRAIIMGSLLGGLLSVTNIYIGLKAGWGFGVSITACILSYAIWTAFNKIGLARTPMTILENNCMQTAASAAGYSTGGTLISAFAAYILLTGQTVPIPLLMGMVFFLAILGVTMAIPMKRQMINHEQLKFPSGVAAAETLKALYGSGSRGIRSAVALGIAALFAMCSKFWLEGFSAISDKLAAFSLGEIVERFNKAVFGAALIGRTVCVSWDLMFIAAGAITGLRVCVSMMIGAILCWLVFVPIGLEREVITLTVTEPIAAPVTLNLDPNVVGQHLAKLATFDAKAGTLKWEGIMTEADRTALLAFSADPTYQTAVQRLYVRSQFRAHEPVAITPGGLKLDSTRTDVRHDAQQARLIMPNIISTAEYEQLRAADASPSYQTALAALYARSRLPSYEPLWAGAALEALPRKIMIPRDLSLRLTHDADNKQLLWRGTMSREEHARVAALSSDPNYVTAVDALAAAATSRAWTNTPDVLGTGVRYDEQAAAFYADGPIDPNAAKALRKSAANNAALLQTFNRLIKASSASRASENFRDLVAWSLWAGTGCMVTSGLLAFFLQWKSALKAFGGLLAMLRPGQSKGDDPVQREMESIETPAWWFMAGQVVGLCGLVWLSMLVFGMPWWQTTIAVLLSFVLAIVACRVTGETDTTPIGAMGKIMQLTFAGLAPGQMVPNLMAANVTAGSAGSSAALLTDLKSGYLLGAHPRKQFLAQFSGIFVGTIVTVLIFSILVPNADSIGNAQFPAPAALTWKAVAEALGKGLSTLHPLKVWSMAIGGAIGILLPVLSMIAPKRMKGWIPSAAGLGLSWTFPFYNALMFFVGAIIGWVLEKRAPKTAEEYTFTVASGLIAGESLMGSGIAAYQAREIIGNLFH